MSKYILEFEKSIKLIDDKIISLLESSNNSGINVDDTINTLKAQLEREKKLIYSNLSRWNKVEIARHQDRPHFTDYLSNIVDDWLELHGDRKYSDDSSMICGFGKINDKKVAIIGQEKGRKTKDKLFRNFGMAKPEGYRKALRIMKLAEKFKLPILTFIDTPGAYPGIGAEERGQSQAIADNLFNMSLIKVPMISFIIGEGASGGALAIGLTDKILCLENSWYSVISPEGCASILFGDTSKNKEAADSLQLTSEDLFNLNIADRIIPEPLGGAHHNPSEVYKNVKEILLTEIDYLQKLNIKDLIENRMNKYNNIGTFIDG
tara:strand:+ start:185 stop:1144 length:960 start_codon:yes stop_codon:yes gene_type:complete